MSYKLNMNLELFLRTHITEEQAEVLLGECINEITDLFITKAEVVGMCNNDSTVEEIIVDDSLWGNESVEYKPYDPFEEEE